MKCAYCLREQVVMHGVTQIGQLDLSYHDPYRQAITIMNGDAVCGEHAAEIIGHTGHQVSIFTP